MAAVAPAATPTPAVRAVAADDLTGNKADGTIVTRSANGASVTVYAPDVQGRRKVVARAPNGATAVSYAYADGRREHQADGWLAQTKVGLTPEYIGAMRAAAPRLGRLDFGDFTQLRAIGVTPEFARGLVAAGFPSISADELVEARAVGVTGAYVSAMRAAGVQGDLDDFIELRAVGLDPGFAARVRASGIKVLKADDLVELKMLGTARAKISERAPQAGGGNPDANPEPDWDPDG
jgi:hypothetical protein